MRSPHSSFLYVGLVAGIGVSVDGALIWLLASKVPPIELFDRENEMGGELGCVRADREKRFEASSSGDFLKEKAIFYFWPKFEFFPIWPNKFPYMGWNIPDVAIQAHLDELSWSWRSSSFTKRAHVGRFHVGRHLGGGWGESHLPLHQKHLLLYSKRKTSLHHLRQPMLHRLYTLHHLTWVNLL